MTDSMFDHLVRNTHLGDIGFAGGRIAAIGPTLPHDGPVTDAGGRLVCAGLVESHIHLDKSGIMSRCTCRQGTLKEAVEVTKAAKRDFTEQDVYDRARSVVERAILHGTLRMRTHVEVDPRIGLTSLRALRRLKHDYGWAIDLQLCVFPQEGLLDDPGCDEILVQGLGEGADLIGGAPYIDTDSHGQIARIFELARRFDFDVDFHLDFDLDPASPDADEVCRQTDAHGWGGRVTIGHSTKLSAMKPVQFETVATRLRDAGVAVTTLPATDLFLMGQDATENIPRGVAPAHKLLGRGVNCSISTNNVLNPFTPYGDCSLLRIANLFANVAQIADDPGLVECFRMITDRPAALMRQEYGIRVGAPADLVVFDATSPNQAVAELAPALVAFKNGRHLFTRTLPTLAAPPR